MTTPPTPGDGETLDRLAGEWWIFQLHRGHRYSTDDVLTAWTACHAAPAAERLLDLCSGSGSVGLMTLLRQPADTTLTTVEVQPENIVLQRKTVALNGLEPRVEIRHGDLRDDRLFRADERFDLITANPPYFRPGSVSPSPHRHRATARLELHGDIFDFCRIAAGRLTGSGRYCFCYPAGDLRPEKAIAGAGLKLLSRRDVVFREGSAPVIALFVCGLEGDRQDAPPLLVRAADGRRTDAYRAVRVEMLLEV